MPPDEFVEGLKKCGRRVEGIGHRIKTAENRDKRVELLSRYAAEAFPSTHVLAYAKSVEAYTLTKASNLVLNIDGCIGALFVDMLMTADQFSPAEVDEVLELGALNGIDHQRADGGHLHGCQGGGIGGAVACKVDKHVRIGCGRGGCGSGGKDGQRHLGAAKKGLDKAPGWRARRDDRRH